MPYPKKISDLSPASEFHAEVLQMHKLAEDYLSAFRWCRRILSCGLYVNLGSVLCVFLFTIDNSQSAQDDRLWVIVGDLPSMYLDANQLNTTKDVLLAYADWAEDWAAHVRDGRSLEACYPFQTEATVEIADRLASRAAFIKTQIVSNLNDVRQRAL